MTQDKRQHGFTLVEMLVYIAVLMVTAVGSIGLLLSLDNLFAKYRAEQKIFRSATTALERIVYDIRSADSVSASSYLYPGTLSLSIDGDIFTYATSSDALHVSENGTDIGPLTETGVKVTDFAVYSYSDVTDFARVRITLSSSYGGITVTETFNAGAVLRGSYE